MITLLIFNVIFLMFLISLISAFEILTFSDSTTSKNITFTEAGSQYVNLSLSKDTSVVSASVFVSEINQSSICYQESANVSTSCGGLSTGVYGFEGLF